jgi:hypothetical protein
VRKAPVKAVKSGRLTTQEATSPARPLEAARGALPALLNLEAALGAQS